MPTPAPSGPTTFQPASLVIGQSTPDTGLENQGGSASATSLYRPSGLALTPEGGLLIADQANNRVVFHASIPATSGAAARAAIGQTSPEGSEPSLTQPGLNTPFGVAVGTSGGAPRMAVADAAANRVLIYDRVPVEGMPMPEPVAVIGQPRFDTGAPGCDADRLSFPTAVAITPGGKLLVVDALNHRVLVWNQVPLAQPAPQPDAVLGQTAMNRCVRNNNVENGDIPARGTLSFPADVWSNDTRLVVADAGNNRVLIWRDFPGGFMPDADVVLGQTGFTSSAPNAGFAQPSAATLQDPEGVHSDGTSLVVADGLNNRVLVWRTFPDNDAQEADVVLGHQTPNQSATNDADGNGETDVPTAHVLHYPTRVLLAPNALFVTDQAHHRVLKFDR